MTGWAGRPDSRLCNALGLADQSGWHPPVLPGKGRPVSARGTMAENRKSNMHRMDKFDSFQVHQTLFLRGHVLQLASECVEHYIMAPYNLPNNCNYGVLEEGTICDTPDKQLIGPACQPLQGNFLGALNHKWKIASQQIFVVKDLKTNLLGVPSITPLSMATRLDSIAT